MLSNVCVIYMLLEYVNVRHLPPVTNSLMSCKSLVEQYLIYQTDSFSSHVPYNCSESSPLDNAIQMCMCSK